MKKESIIGFVIWMLLFIAAAIVGFIFLREYSSHSGLVQWQFILFFAGAIIGGLLFNAILFELAHMLGAKLGGYEIISVCILGLCFAKKDGKRKVFFSKYDGLCGETKILPKKRKNKKKNNPVLYSVMGTIFFGIEFIIILTVFFMFKDSWNPDAVSVVNKNLSNLAYFLMTFAVVGLIVLVYNILPFKLDSMTDGYRLRLISNKENKNAYNDYLYAEAGISSNETMINEDGEEKPEVKENVFTADIKLNEVYKYLDKEDYKSALTIVDDILSDVSNKTPYLVLRAKAQKAYIVLMVETLENSQKFYDEQLDAYERKDMSEDGTLPCIRAYVLLSGLLDKSQSECIYVLKKAYKAYKRTPDGIKPIEIRLYNKAIDKVMQAHPSWDLDQYKMYEIND